VKGKINSTYFFTKNTFRINWRPSLPAKWCILLVFFIGFGAFSVRAQSLTEKEIKEQARDYLLPSLEHYRDFLKIPNNGRYTEHRQQNVDWCLQTFQQLDFKTQVLESEGIPHVLATKVYHPDYKTILFYLQIDGQPVDSSKWDQPNPYEPVLKKKIADQWEIVNWETLASDFDPDLRVFARSASDSKGPAMAFISALTILKAAGVKPAFNVKVIMDFQEELGSPTLGPLVSKEPDLFAAEMVLIMDGTRHLSNLPTLTFGARGIATATLKVFGALDDLHSGQYGNFAPNPVFKLSRLLADMKDEEGRVLIPGFYDGVELSESDKKILNNLPESMEEIKRTLGIAEVDQVGATYQEAMQYPSLNIRGLRAAWVGKEVRTLIPSEAIAEIDMRLVVETPGERQVQLLRDFIISKGYHFVDGTPTEEERKQYPKLMAFTYRLGSQPFRTEMNSKIGHWLSKSMEYIFADQFVSMRTTGGSQPMAPFITTLGIPAVSIRIPNPDNSIHAPNENLRIGNYLEGIQMCLSILVQEMD
jgi:acetylornithine deacetylase/succinyl-diaminopimelate desuccinylase-like protein